MSQAARKLLEGFDSLPEPDQETVSAEILRRTIEQGRVSFDETETGLAEPDALLTDEQRDEIDRRLAEHDRNPEAALSWQEIRTRLYRRFA